MPRRRGEYTLIKSTSFSAFPFVDSIDKANCCYSAKNTGQGTCKAKIRLNITISDASNNCNHRTNYDCEQLSPLINETNQQLTRNDCDQELMVPNSRNLPKNSPVLREHFYTKNSGQNRAASYDPVFRIPLKYPLEKLKIRATGKNQVKKENVDCFVNLVAGKMMGMEQRYDKAGRDSRKKLRKMHKSKSDAFVNSQEWTLSRGVCELKLGLVGSLHSGKTSLVHRYLTGAYTNEDSPEGGRFKKEVVLDGQSYLLLIRDEGSAAPDYQFAQWVDAVIFVFSLESQESIEIALHFYEQMAKFRNINEVPILMVGTQDAVTESNPRVITEQEGRQMVKKLPRCSAYYEACSTYGLNVDRVFKDACQKILQQRIRLLGGFSSSTRTPASGTSSAFQRNSSNDHRSGGNYQELGYSNGYNSKGPPYHHQRSVSALPLQEHSQQQIGNSGRHGNGTHCGPNVLVPPNSYAYRESSNLTPGLRGTGTERSVSAFVMPSAPASHLSKMQRQSQYNNSSSTTTCPAPSSNHNSGNVMSINNGITHIQSSPRTSSINAAQIDQALLLKDEVFDNQIPLQQPPSGPTTSRTHLVTPSSTPTAQRRNRRISNLFQRPKDHHGHEDKSHRPAMDINMGMGRTIPVKQGHLYKRSSKTLNKEWKKKYVCLHSDGRLSYHQTLKDYMEKDANGKEVFLGLATVRVAGRQKSRNIQRAQTQLLPGSSRDFQVSKDCKRESLNPVISGNTCTSDSNTSAGQDNKAFTDELCTNGEGTSGGSDDQQQNATSLATNTNCAVMVSPAVVSNGAGKKKKSHRRLGSAVRNEEEDDCEFEIVTCDQKRWEFSATSVDERDEWVKAIEELIEKSLQAQMSQKQQSNSRAHGNKAEVQALRQIPGNDNCADCGALNPVWASLNLGTLICIECSGIHRNLGSHISKVRSLDLDDWPMEYLTVMEAIGNDKANAVWEHHAPKDKKPQANSSRDEKEKWIKLKYEGKRFLPSVAVDQPLGRQLLNAVFNNDLSALLPILPHCSTADLRTTVDSNDKRTALHIACSNASAACTQLLVWYNADLRMLDDMGRSALWHAQTSGALDCASILINAGLDPKHGIPNGPEMITGSLSSREFCTSGDKLLTSDAKLRRQSDVVVRRISTGQQNTPAINGYHQRASDAFERLPASII